MYTYKSVTTIVPLVVKCNRPSCTVINFSESKIPSKGRKITTDTNKIFLQRSFDTIVNTLSAILKSQAISLIGLIGKKRNFLFYTRIHFLTTSMTDSNTSCNTKKPNFFSRQINRACSNQSISIDRTGTCL